MAVSIEQFGKSLVASGLLTAEDVKALWNGLPASERPKDGETFSSLLVKQEKLNTFQAQALLSGSGTPLVLGDYVLLAKIGAGGMGAVYRAQHRHMDRLAAIKLLPAALTKDEGAVKRFQREVKAAAKLSHPNIVQTFDASVQRGVWYLVMECVEGQDLSALVKQRGPLPVQEAVDYILQAARGLAFAHGKGVVHRDIKPANLLLDSEGTVKILDMGLARFDTSGDAADHQLTNTGAVMGTVDYMAPEQAQDTHAADARSDIYSLGCSLFRMMTGESVYQGDTVVKKIFAHAGDPIPSLLTNRPDCPAEIDRIFQKMLAKRPDDRYQQAAQVVAELEAWRNPGATTSFSGSTAGSQDANLNDFLRSVGGAKPASSQSSAAVKTATKHTVVGVPEQTAAYSGADVQTDPKSEIVPSLVTSAKPSPTAKTKVGGKGGKKPPVKLIAAGAAGFLFLLLGVWVIIRDKDGQEVARVKVPEGGTATVQAPTPPKTISTPKPTVPTTPTPSPPTKSPAVATSSPAGTAPPLAVAPFDAAQAKAHQDDWAKHLGTTVETANSVGAKMVLIPPGEFLMGTSDEKILAGKKYGEEQPTKDAAHPYFQMQLESPQHLVQLTRPLLVAECETTTKQFRTFIEDSGYVTTAEADSKPNKGCLIAGSTSTEVDGDYSWRNPGWSQTDAEPVVLVSWGDAVEFCNWLSRRENLSPFYIKNMSGQFVFVEGAAGYRLPTEAEWEFACRAGTTTDWWWGDDAKSIRNMETIAATSIADVGRKFPNPFGIYDLGGSVSELCQDYFATRYDTPLLSVNPQQTKHDGRRVIRGGSFRAQAVSARSARRGETQGPQYSIGFRIVRTLYAPTTTANVTPQPAVPAAASAKLFMHDPAFPQWMKDVQVVPAEKQIEAVSKKLVELNPGFDGVMSEDGTKPPRIEQSSVTILKFNSEKVADISPLRVFAGLKQLRCFSTFTNVSKLADLTPLRGLPLTHLQLDYTMVSDLSPLSGMPLNDLRLRSTQVTELAPLQDCKSLQRLIITGKNPHLAAAQIVALQKALPHCKIEWDDPAKMKVPQPAVQLDADRRAAEWVLSIGGELDVVVEGKEIRDVSELDQLPIGPIQVVVISLVANTRFSDADLERLQTLQSLRSLRLSNSSVTDLGLKQLKDVPNLNFVALEGTRITDDGLSHLAALKLMGTLNLNSTRTTDFGLAKLKELPRLSSLNVTGTHVTAAGVTDFHAASPFCLIRWGRVDGTIEEPAVDFDRPAAEWVLSIGGSVCVNFKPEKISASERLPKVKFQLTSIMLAGGPAQQRAVNAGLDKLQYLLTLESLNLSYTDASDSTLLKVRHLPRLNTLHLNGTRIGDVAMEHFSTFEGLRYIGLDDTAVTDAGLQKLSTLPEVQQLFLSGAPASGTALAKYAALSHVKLDAKQARTLTGAESISVLNLVDADDDCIQHLCRMKLKRLTDVRFSGKRPSLAGITAILEAYPNCLIDGKSAVPQPAASGTK